MPKEQKIDPIDRLIEIRKEILGYDRTGNFPGAAMAIYDLGWIINEVRELKSNSTKEGEQ